MRTVARVSVVMPAFNAARTVERAIASACAQTLADLEILVVDDASTDDTAARIRALAAADPRVRLLSQRVNAGPGAARNRAIDEARGAWVAVLDADDRFESDRLERLVAFAEEQGADIVADNPLLESAEGARPPEPMIPPERLTAPERIGLARFVALNEGGIDRALRQRLCFSYGFLKPLFHRDFLAAHALRYDPRNRYAEDYMFAVRCLFAGAKWWLLPMCGYRYTVNEGSATHVQSAGDLGRLVDFDRRYLADPAVGGVPESRRAFRAHLRSVERRFHYRRFVDALKSGRYADAGNAFFETGASAADVIGLTLANAPLVAAKALRGGYAGPSAARLRQGVPPR
jgi:glycosyltransferase involved in cell wall biosynthesis